MITIVSGTVEVIMDDVVIATRGPGEVVGEMSLIDNSTRSATVVAAGDCEIEEWSRDRFIAQIKEDPTFALNLLKCLSQRLRESDALRVAELEQNNYNLKIANKELSLVNDFLEQLIEQSPAGIVITNKQGEVKRANPAALRIFDVVDNASWNSLLSYFPTRSPIESLWTSLKPSWVGEFRAQVGERTRMLYLSVSRLYSYDPESSYLFICEDISELIELNEQIVKLERFATEGEISSGIAHDIKNYLAILRGNFDLMMYKINQEFREKQQHHIAAMERGFTEIESFVENLMGGRSDAEVVAEVSLPDMVKSLIRILAPQKRFQHIKMTTVFDSSFPLLLRVKEKQIQQVLLNLLINAADALNGWDTLQSREIKILLSVEKDSGRPQLIVADNGPGIPQDKQAELFSRRFTTKETGHGIGLMTVKKIVDQHQGTIAIESNPGAGTKFTITFKN